MSTLQSSGELHADDVVVRRTHESLLAVVEATHADVDTHVRLPAKSEFNHITRDQDIPKRDFKKFLHDGVPPVGTVVVRWQHNEQAELIQESKLVLFDRSLLAGDVVKRSAQDAMSGVIISTQTKCTLQPLSDLELGNEHRLKGILPWSGIEIPMLKSPNPLPPLVDIPLEELDDVTGIKEEDLAVYKNWIGQVGPVHYMITLKLADSCVVEIDEALAEHADGAIEFFQVGDIAMTKKGKLRTGKWIYGQYNPNTPPVGTVVATRLVNAEISWIQRRIASKDDIEPPEIFERDELESPEFRIYDPTKRPLRSSGNGTDISTVTDSEHDIRLSGVRVRFKDLVGACEKYNGSTRHGKLSRIDRKDTLGYDLNVFEVTRFTTNATVQWQDLTITHERSIDLIPETAIDDEHAAWPGEIVHTLDLTPVPGMVAVKQPGRVGVVQSVNAGERMAKVKWCPDACYQYSIDEEDKESFKALLTAAVGVAAGEEESVSLYEVEAPGETNVRRGDIVLLTKEPPANTNSATGSRDFDWLGEIVDTCLDGTLIVRLGVADIVRDVKLRREEVIVAIRSDGTDQMDNWMDDEMSVLHGHEDAAMEMDSEGFLEHWEADPFYGNEYMHDEDLDNFDDENDWTDDEEVAATYEDENGQPMDEDEVENEEWESDDGEEGNDTDMPDATAQETPQTSQSHTSSPPNLSNSISQTAQTNGEMDSRTVAPEPYLILEGAVPSSHHFASQPSTATTAHVKRTQKEHKMIRSPGALPKGVYVRTWESRMDLVRVLIIGPAETPYADAPFVFDFYLPSAFPAQPPEAHFHSWPSDGGLGGVGRVNPNLYEDGKICLSLLGTWEGNRGEGWSATRSTLLQVIVSILGLVLVREPYFNEAGYEPLAGLDSYKRPSALYSERIFLRSKTFIICALDRISGATASGGCEGLDDIIRWLYLDPSASMLLRKTIGGVQEVLQTSERGGDPNGLTILSKGACIPLRRVLARLRSIAETGTKQ